MAFHEVQFPPQIAYGAVGGPVWSTVVTATAAGIEQRNQAWVNARHQYEVGTGIRSLGHFASVLRFFHARRGRLHGFRFKDWQDFTSSTAPTVAVTPLDQALGGYAGLPLPLAKTYADTAGGWTRSITRPVAGTLRVAVNGTEQASPGWSYPWAVDTTTGLLSFTGSGATLPTPGAAITAGFEFDVPVRFDTDRLPGSYETWQAVAVRDITLIEIRI